MNLIPWNIYILYNVLLKKFLKFENPVKSYSVNNVKSVRAVTIFIFVKVFAIVFPWGLWPYAAASKMLRATRAHRDTRVW